MIAKVYRSGSAVRLVQGPTVEHIARVQFCRNGMTVSVHHQKGTTWAVTAPFGQGGVGVIGRIRIMEG